MVKSAVAWHWNRAKVQWDFLGKVQRRRVKMYSFWSVFWVGLLVLDLYSFGSYAFIPRPAWIFFDVLMIYGAAAMAWNEYTNILSPKILTHEELTRGTE